MDVRDDILIVDDESSTCMFCRSWQRIKSGWHSFLRSDMWKCDTTVRLCDYDGFADTH